MLERIKATVPGSCMLLGEYAVLFNEPALVCAINRYIEVTLTPLPTSQVIINSSLGHFQGDLHQLTITPPLEFVLTAIQQTSATKKGFILDIKADFSDQYGFGSSAAVTVATIAVLLRYYKQIFTPQELIIKARTTIQTVQGNGSGADVAASVLGGLITYQKEPLFVEQIPFSAELHLIYSGKKARTKDVIKAIINEHARNESLKRLFTKCRKNHHLAVRAIQSNHWDILGETLEIHQDILDLLGTSTPTLTHLVSTCKKIPGIIGAKTSGAGFGDCIIAVGQLPPHTFPRNKKEKKLGIQQFDIKLSPLGVEIIHEPFFSPPLQKGGGSLHEPGGFLL